MLMNIYQLLFFFSSPLKTNPTEKDNAFKSQANIKSPQQTFIYFCFKVCLQLFSSAISPPIRFLLLLCTSHQSAKDLTGWDPQKPHNLLELIPAHLALSTSVSLSLLHLQGGIHVYSALHNKTHTLASTKSP